MGDTGSTIRALTLAAATTLGTLFAPALAAQTGETARPTQCMGSPSVDSYLRADQCLAVWLENVQKTGLASLVARWNLESSGGRTIVDSLRALYKRAPKGAVHTALVNSIATTASADDIDFLQSELQAGRWSGDLATVLGYLRLATARTGLESMRDKSGENTFNRSAAEWALSVLDQPPCTDSLSGILERELVLLVMRCQPHKLAPGRSYHSSYGDSIWTHVGSSWQLVGGSAADTASSLSVITAASVAADSTRATVSSQWSCGRLCSENRTYQLIRTGKVWRVVNAILLGVS